MNMELQSMRLFVTICVVGVMISSAQTQETKDTMEKVKSGTETGKAILDIFAKQKDSKDFKRIGEIADKVAPYLGAIGPAIQLITLFLPKSPSDEMIEIKKGFAKIDAEFDQVFDQFKDVKNILKEMAITIQYNKYAMEIEILSSLLQDFLQKPYDQASTHKRAFINVWEETDGRGLTGLILGMTTTPDMGDNIPIAAMEFTDNNRKKTQEVMVTVLGLIMKGMKVNLAYYELKGKRKDYIAMKQKYEEKLRNVLNVIMEMDRRVKDEWYNELRGNIDSKLAMWYDKNNEEFASELYAFLTDKFDWRDWLVVAYKDLYGGDKHWSSVCGGYHRFREHGRNLIVASVDENKSPIDRNHAWEITSNVKTRACKKFWGGRKCWDLQAKEVFANLPADFKEGCTYASVGVIEKDAEVAYRAHFHRFTTVENNKYKIHAFG